MKTIEERAQQFMIDNFNSKMTSVELLVAFARHEMTRIEEKINHLSDHDKVIAEMFQSGHSKLEAIKYHRYTTNDGLYNAKHYVEKIQYELGL